MTTKCEAIKVKYTAASECERPQSDETGHHYEFLEYRPGERINAFLWALVADESPASSPTDAEIARRVDLLTVAATVSTPPTFGGHGYAGLATDGSQFWIMSDGLPGKWMPVDSSVFGREARGFAVRQLIAERGGK